jgi:transposase
MTDTRVDVVGGVFGGVDTHGRTHHAAVVDALGRHLADQEFPASTAGEAALVAWLGGHGQLVKVGVEGTGAYGAPLTRALQQAGISVVEVDRPDRRTRRARGKSDPIDAYAAAVAAASGRAATIPKNRDGIVEAIRALRAARSSAVKARTQTINQIKALVVTAPAGLREQFAGLTTTSLVAALARLRPGTELADPTAATKAALRHLARRHRHLTEEITELDADLDTLTAQAAPALRDLYGVGVDTAGALLVTAGDNPHRLRSEASFAHLCGVAPIPASSGARHRHRLNRGGDRTANKALYTIVVVRMRHDERTRAYVTRRSQEGLSKKDIIRCLKRYIAREIYRALTKPPTRPTTSETAA